MLIDLSIFERKKKVCSFKSFLILMQYIESAGIEVFLYVHVQ